MDFDINLHINIYSDFVFYLHPDFDLVIHMTLIFALIMTCILKLIVISKKLEPCTICNVSSEKEEKFGSVRLKEDVTLVSAGDTETCRHIQVARHSGSSNDLADKQFCSHLVFITAT